MLFWREIERVIQQYRARSFDSIILGRVANGFVDALTGARKKLRATSAEVLVHLVRTIAVRATVGVLQEHGAIGGGKGKITEISVNWDCFDTPSSAGAGEEREILQRLLDDLLSRQVGFPETSSGSGAPACPLESGSAELSDLLLDLPDDGGCGFRAALKRAVQRLPEDQLRALALVAYHPGWSHKELVEEFGRPINASTFRCYLQRARNFMRKEVGEILSAVEAENAEEARLIRRLCRVLELEPEVPV